MRGGEAEKLTDRKDAIRSFRWSPDGRRIALLMPEAKTDREQQRERTKTMPASKTKTNGSARSGLSTSPSHVLTQITYRQLKNRQIEFDAGWRPR